MRFHWSRVLFLGVVLFLGGNVSSAAFLPRGAVKARIFPEKNGLVFTTENQRGWFFSRGAGHPVVKLTPGEGEIYFSHNGRRLGFKWIQHGQRGRPILFEPATGRKIQLPAQEDRVGPPSFSRNGTVAYADGRQIVLTDTNGVPFRRLDMPNYSNLTPISPDGKWVAYNDETDQIWILATDGTERRKITDDRHAYFHPAWDSTATRLLVQSVDGKIFVADVHRPFLREIAEGTAPNWSPHSDWIVYQKPVWSTRGFISDWDIAVVRPEGNETLRLTRTPNRCETSPQFLSENRVAFVTGNSVVEMPFEGKPFILQKSRQSIRLPSPEGATNLLSPAPKSLHPQTVNQSEILDLPYVHQVYDTPDWFDGYWACQAASAVMVVAYYSILPKWSLYVTQPFGHRTYYGRYICYVYHFYRHTFNLWTYDRLGHKGYGAYGFITQKNWADTKGYMARYFQYHGLQASVDWSPTWAELRREVDGGRPFALLNSLTSAGHYIDVVGYYLDRSVAVNDPYGDKNRGYVNYYGKQAVYDWPGYNNGNANLNTVWCFIYAKKSVDWIATALAVPDSLKAGSAFSAKAQLVNGGLAAGDSVTVGLYLSPDKTISSRDWLICARKIPPIMPGDSVSVALTGRLPTNIPSLMLFAGVLVDPAHQQPEADRTDDQFALPVAFTGLPTILRVSPAAGSVISQKPLRVEVDYSDPIAGIDTSGVRFFFNGRDMTAECEISETALKWVSQNPPAGRDSARVVVTNRAGFSKEENWVFSVQWSSSVEKKPRGSPARFVLYQNTPNPFRADKGTTLRFRLGRPVPVRVVIYSVTGEKVRDWSFARLPSGEQHLYWNGRDESGRRLASGIYFLHLHAGNWGSQTRLVLLK